MAKNPLGDAKKTTAHRSAYHASEWARAARSKGDAKASKAWEEADAEGWDYEHFDQSMRDDLIDKLMSAHRISRHSAELHIRNGPGAA
jgi:hypothetical protein